MSTSKIFIWKHLRKWQRKLTISLNNQLMPSKEKKMNNQPRSKKHWFTKAMLHTSINLDCVLLALLQVVFQWFFLWMISISIQSWRVSPTLMKSLKIRKRLQSRINWLKLSRKISLDSKKLHRLSKWVSKKFTIFCCVCHWSRLKNWPELIKNKLGKNQFFPMGNNMIRKFLKNRKTRIRKKQRILLLWYKNTNRSWRRWMTSKKNCMKSWFKCGYSKFQQN